MGDRYEIASLGRRFEALWARYLSPECVADGASIYATLVSCYHERHRRYHTFAHIVHCLEQLDRAAAATGRQDAVELALWFHDAIYVPGSADNEQRSADLFVQCSGSEPSSPLVDKVSQLILVTAHRTMPANEEACQVVDIDLSSFGLPWAEFLRDSHNVRDEQTQLADHEYYPAHARFLRSLLDRPRIFHTDYFCVAYESSARQNITRLLDLPPFNSNP